MIESIGTKLTSIVGAILPTFYSEAETETYPYAAYDQVLQYHRTKDGVYKISSDLKLIIVSNDFDEADRCRGEVLEAIEIGMKDDQYQAELQTVNKDCMEGVWVIEMNYRINQYK